MSTCLDGEVTLQFRSNYIYAGAPRPELEVSFEQVFCISA